ncbi:acyl-CoA dehydrogenase [Microbulbifer flavimaris]|uniref:Acyl-CoA dehydrogenase n=1 Tax=Microbulbifer flavimaris TaxID=1781068 RepID=A0ABX4I365_9GAMM|nr:MULTISPECIES: acyl-CoA dehydrogenase [Microbulbifer]KUJ84270.1 acyl-CoA dehydrogenase [Microbulbifer sp. ZGT114]PCO06347.1 acyl-CoA dehydrogenase [Microbulbifer flavimaris]
MDTPLLNERDIDFLLYELLDTESLLQRPRYREHSREIFNATLQSARTVAEKHFANHNAKGDANEPHFDGERVHLIPETKQAWDAFAEAGFLAAHCDEEEGGLQLPEVILRTALAYVSAANVASAAYPFLTIGAANLIRSFASDDLKARFLPPMLDGRFSGTMALTEPDQGSALGDLRTTATAAGDGSYRIRGQKMYISGGDHSLTDNIVHMVLARIEGAPAGVRGISLFLVPRNLVDDKGNVGERNDVQLAGLLHKMGYRNTTSTVLSFGEGDGAVGYLVGEPHRGLGYMFQMMNEARIGVGMGATVLGYQGYNHALEYARSRPQGRLPSSRDARSPQVPIIRHGDVRRMLLAQKAYVEGALALCLYASSLHEDQRTAPGAEGRSNAAQLLDLLTPVIKSWPSRYGVVANDIAIQVLGGAGYIREYPLEQLYRDNRLNPIHEGTEGIQGLDLLARKVPAEGLAGYQLLQGAIRQTVMEARDCSSLAGQAGALEKTLQQLDETTLKLMGQLQADPDRGLANATLYLDAFGRVVVAWIWLRQALAAERGLADADSDTERHFYRGKLQAARYFSEWELPQAGPQLTLLSEGNSTPYEMEDAWF